MSLRVLQELPYLAICYDYNNEWLFAEWRDEITLERAREGGEAILRFVKDENCTKLLNDNSQVTNMWLETPEWRSLNLFPRLQAAGLHYVAWVYSPNLYSRFSVDRAIETLRQPVVLPFEELTIAKSWLRIV